MVSTVHHWQDQYKGTTSMDPRVSQQGSVRKEATVVVSRICVPRSGWPPNRLARMTGMTAEGMAAWMTITR